MLEKGIRFYSILLETYIKFFRGIMKKIVMTMLFVSFGALYSSSNQNQLVAVTSQDRHYFEACQKGDFKAVKEMVESGSFDIRVTCEKSLSGACRAALFGHKELFSYLVLQGVHSEFKQVHTVKEGDSELL